MPRRPTPRLLREAIRRRRRVVVTGVGLLTPFGSSVSETWSQLVAGRSAVDRVSGFDASTFPTRIAAEVRGFESVKAPFGALLNRKSQFGWIASVDALNDAALCGCQSSTEIGTAIGSERRGDDLLH